MLDADPVLKINIQLSNLRFSWVRPSLAGPELGARPAQEQKKTKKKIQSFLGVNMNITTLHDNHGWFSQLPLKWAPRPQAEVLVWYELWRDLDSSCWEHTITNVRSAKWRMHRRFIAGPNVKECHHVACTTVWKGNRKTFCERNMYVVFVHLYKHEAVMHKKGNVCVTGPGLRGKHVQEIC